MEGAGFAHPVAVCSSVPAEKKLKLSVPGQAGCREMPLRTGSRVGGGHSPARDPAARMVSSVLIGPLGTQPSWPPLRAKRRVREAGKLCRLGSWLHPGSGLRAGPAGRVGPEPWGRVQRCLVWVLQHSRSWVGVEGVPFLDAESSHSDGPACLSGWVAGSSQDSSVVIRELGAGEATKTHAIQPYQQFGTG